MELPRRTRGDELLKPGELTRLRERLRSRAQEHDVTSVIACAFDHRTRMLPFIFADTRMILSGAIPAALLALLVDAALGGAEWACTPPPLRTRQRAPGLSAGGR